MTKQTKEIAIPEIVLMCETGGCFFETIYLAWSCMMNRRHHRGFDKGRLETLFDVVNEPNAFECIGDYRNRYWRMWGKVEGCITAFKNLLTIRESFIFDYCQTLCNSTKTIPYPDIVYFQDKRSPDPDIHDNKYWDAIKVLTTQEGVVFSRVEGK